MEARPIDLSNRVVRGVIRALIDTLKKDEDTELRVKVVGVLGWSTTWHTMKGGAGVLPALIETLKKDKDSALRAKVVDALAYVLEGRKYEKGDKEVIAALAETLKTDKDAKLRGTALKALQTLGRNTGWHTLEVNEQVIAALTETLVKDKDAKLAPRPWTCSMKR